MSGFAFLTALLLLATPGPEGRYRLVGEQDVASQLELTADGRFRYALAAGALDEYAEGRWRRDGDSVLLTTEPRPVAPLFSPGAASRAGGPLEVRVVSPGGDGIAGVDIRIGFDAGEPLDDYTQEEGWTLPADEKREPRWIELAVPMHDLASPRFPIDAAAADRLVFVLVPNDLGIVDFQDLRLDVEPGGLAMHRYGGTLRYERIED